MQRKTRIKLVNYTVCALFTATFATSSVQADQVYRWEDAEGTVHYSSEAPELDAKPAELPRITRGRLGLQSQQFETCDKHGGINCQSGADIDGSVICTDGFRATPTRFRFHCNSPKLDLADIGDIKNNGEFSILVRNSRSVAAQKPELILRLNQASAGIILSGPAKIDPFEVGEFLYKASEHGVVNQKPRPDQVTVTCMNCEN
jgi:hypothetical protein